MIYIFQNFPTTPEEAEYTDWVKDRVWKRKPTFSQFVDYVTTVMSYVYFVTEFLVFPQDFLEY